MTDDLQVGTETPVVVEGEPVAADPVSEPPTGPPQLEDQMDWSWPPYAPLEPAGGRRFDCADWAPSSAVRRPRLRVGRWTLLYRRGA